MDTRALIAKAKYIFERLSSKPLVGGLHISDYALQYVVLGAGLSTAIVKMPPGIVKEGRILDEVQFQGYLKKLHQAVETDEKKTVPVVVVLPSSIVYTQSFSVPNVGSDRLEESAALNIQMISPMAPETSYMSWQVVKETPDQYELLGAFAERPRVDVFQKVLEEARFSPVAFEFPSLALARLVALAGNADDHPSLLFQISSDGLNLSILKNKGLYFDYFRSWRSIQGEEREITQQRFEAVLAEEMQKISHFTLSRFKENPQKVFMIAPGFEKTVQSFIQTKFGISVVLLQIAAWNISSQWYVAVGAALRENESRQKETLINVGSVSHGGYFYEEQALNFIRLWRGVSAAVLGVLLVFFGGSAYVLANEVKAAKGNLSMFSANIPSGELARLEEQVKQFNALVGNARSKKEGTIPWTYFFSKMNTITVANRAVIDHIEIASLKDRITLSAHVADSNAIIVFKNALAADKDFADIDLLVSQIAVREDGSAGFQITFRFVGTGK